MTETPQEHRDGPDEVPTDENLDVEGPNESAQPTGAPGLEPDESSEGSEDGNG
jgi:hypothetical protein